MTQSAQDPASRQEPAPTPAQVRSLLLDAVNRGDNDLLKQLCVTHAAMVRESFGVWVAEATGSEAEGASQQGHAGGLYAIAKVFANHLADGSLLKLLLGPGAANPLAEWEKKLSRAKNLIDRMEYAPAMELLTNQLIDARKLAGHGYSHLSATTHWYLSQCFWLQRDFKGAVAHGQRSLEITRRIHDDEKYLTRYLRHLYEVHRYFSQPGPAADYADQLHRIFVDSGDNDAARVFAAQSRIVRAGEPLTRVVAWIGRARYELDEVPQEKPDSINLAIERNRVSLQPCGKLMERGQSLAQQKQQDEAVAAFRQAAVVDPCDPEPLLYLAYTMLGSENYIEAVDCFEKAQELAPGWPSAHSGLWLARQLMDEKLESWVVLALMTLNDSAATPQQQLGIVQQAIDKLPSLAVFHLHHGKVLKGLNSTNEAAQAFRRGLACEGDAVRAELMLELARLLPNGDERTGLLQAAAAGHADLITTGMARLMLRCGW